MLVLKRIPFLLGHVRTLIKLGMTAWLAKILRAQSHDCCITALNAPAFSESQLIAMGGLSPAGYSASYTRQLPNNSKQIVISIDHGWRLGRFGHPFNALITDFVMHRELAHGAATLTDTLAVVLLEVQRLAGFATIVTLRGR